MADGIRIDIKTNAMDAKHFFNRLHRSQLPYAMSRAVNKLAYDVRDDEQADLDKYFNIRTPWLTKRGAMPVIRSNKRQAPDIHAILGVKDAVAAQAAIGGKRPNAGGGDMAIPLSNAGQGQSARSILNPRNQTLPRSKWPTNIVKERKATTTRRRGRALKPKPFYMESRSGRKFVALRSSTSRLPLQFLYEFKKDADMPKSWPLVDNVRRYVASNYDSVLSSEIAKAIRSSKY